MEEILCPCYDYYLEAGTARDLPWLEHTNPQAAPLRDWLLEVARKHGPAIKGEATKVVEGELMPVAFKETTLFLVEHQGEPFVPMKPVVEGIGLNWDSQLDKLRGNEGRWSVAEIATVAGDGKRRKMSCLPLRRFFGWLMTISPNKIKPELKEKIIAYQQECDEVLWNYWNAKLNRQRPALPFLADTPPHEPLSFPFKPLHGGEVRVAIWGGQAQRHCSAFIGAAKLDPPVSNWKRLTRNYLIENRKGRT